MKNPPKNLQKSKPLGACLFLASQPTPNITDRSIRRHDEKKTRPIGRFEDPELQARLQKMSGWERTIWGRGGHPTGEDQITAALTFAFRDWSRYRRAQRLRRATFFWGRAGMSLDEIGQNFTDFAAVMAGASDDARGMAETLSEPWAKKLMEHIANWDSQEDRYE